MTTELTAPKLQRILDFFSVGTLKAHQVLDSMSIKVREKDEISIDSISGAEVVLPSVLEVNACILWTTHGGYLLFSVPPEKERRALQNIPKPFDFLKKSLGLHHIQSVSNFEDPKFTTCHMYDKYHYLFPL